MIPIVVDSSFLISFFRKEEQFHNDSVDLMDQIYLRKNNARIILPSIVFFETIFNLSKIGEPKMKIQKALWSLLYADQVFNVNLLETSSFRLLKKYPTSHLKGFKTSDFLILSTALAFDACLLTYDKKLRKNAGQIYNKIYYCDSKDSTYSHDSNNFLTKLQT